MSPPERPPDARSTTTGGVEFFIDRSLGRRHLAQELRGLGLVVHTMASVYGERVAQELEDERWLADAGEHGWVVLMKDDKIRRRPSERDALSEAMVRAFCLTNAQLRLRAVVTVRQQHRAHLASSQNARPLYLRCVPRRH